MFEKVKQAIHVGRHVTDMMRLPCVYSCHKEADGTLKLEESEGTYYMLVETDNRYHPFVSVILGDSTEAVRLLTYMSELKLGKNDRGVYLENISENVIMKGPLGAFNIYEKTVTICGVAHRLNIKKLLKALTEGGRERKPSYRHYDDED